MHKKIPEVSLLKFLSHSANILKNPLPFHHKNFEEKGDTFKLKIGLKNSVIFSRDASLAEYVLKTNNRNYTKSKIQTEDLGKYVGHGLLTAEGDHWRRQRKLIQPAFHKKQLSDLMGSVKDAILNEYQKIEPNKNIDVFPIYNDLAFQTVVKSLFSSAANSNQIDRLQTITESVQSMMVKELRQPYLGWWFTISGKLNEHLDLAREAKQILINIVDERKASNTRHNDLLDMLLDAKYEDGSSMKEQHLIEEILILFTAGHETTSNALTFTMQHLAKYPEWQEKIFNQTKDLESQTDDLMEFIIKSTYAQQVIEETLRLYPPVYFIDRVNIKDDAFGDFKFKAGTNFLFSIHEIHKNPELWDKSYEFLPERFMNGGRRYSSHYFPFGAGPRKCIGNNFAMFEMILAVIEIVKNYKLIPKFEEIEIKPLITLKPKNAIILFEERITG